MSMDVNIVPSWERQMSLYVSRVLFIYVLFLLINLVDTGAHALNLFFSLCLPILQTVVLYKLRNVLR